MGWGTAKREPIFAISDGQISAGLRPTDEDDPTKEFACEVQLPDWMLEQAAKARFPNVSPEQYGDATKFQSVLVNDLVIFAGRQWIVTGVYIGAMGQESVATLQATDKKEASNVGSPVVPLEFLYGRIYRYQQPGDPAPQQGEG